MKNMKQIGLDCGRRDEVITVSWQEQRRGTVAQLRNSFPQPANQIASSTSALRAAARANRPGPMVPKSAKVWRGLAGATSPGSDNNLGTIQGQSPKVWQNNERGIALPQLRSQMNYFYKGDRTGGSGCPDASRVKTTKNPVCSSRSARS